MYGARIIEQAPTKNLKTPAHPYTQALLAAISDPDAANSTSLNLFRREPPSLINPPLLPFCPVVTKQSLGFAKPKTRRNLSYRMVIR